MNMKAGPNQQTELSMKSKVLLTLVALTASLFCSAIAFAQQTTHSMEARKPMVRIAELEIDAAQLDAYKAALKEEIEDSIRLEPGVLTLYAVSLKESPTSIRIFETYADENAYKAHIQSPHFLKYKTGTAKMVKSLRLVETDPVLLGANELVRD
jgi:quinol monooxygenase YgiN